MLIWCGCDYHTKYITEETDAEMIEMTEIEMETKRKFLRIELIERIVDDGQLFRLASACRIKGELGHLSVQAQSFPWDPRLYQGLLSWRLH